MCYIMYLAEARLLEVLTMIHADRALQATLLMFAVVLTGSCHADLIYLVNGGVLEGNARREGDKVVVQTPAGRITLAARKVDHIVKQPTVLDEYTKRFKGISDADAGAAGKLAELGTWCTAKGLKNQARTCFARALELDRDNATAREALGYRKYDGRWMKPDEVRQAQGLVKYKDAWVTPEAKADLMKIEAEAALEKARAEKERLKMARLEAEREEARRRAQAEEAARRMLHDAYYNRFYQPVYIWRDSRRCTPRYLPPVAPGPGYDVRVGPLSPLGVPTIRLDGTPAKVQTITPTTGLKAPTVRVLPPDETSADEDE